MQEEVREGWRWCVRERAGWVCVAGGGGGRCSHLGTQAADGVLGTNDDGVGGTAAGLLDVDFHSGWEAGVPVTWGRGPGLWAEKNPLRNYVGNALAVILLLYSYSWLGPILFFGVSGSQSFK